MIVVHLLVEDGGIKGGLAVGSGGEGLKGGREVTIGTGGFLIGGLCGGPS